MQGAALTTSFGMLNQQVKSAASKTVAVPARAPPPKLDDAPDKVALPVEPTQDQHIGMSLLACRLKHHKTMKLRRGNILGISRGLLSQEAQCTQSPACQPYTSMTSSEHAEECCVQIPVRHPMQCAGQGRSMACRDLPWGLGSATFRRFALQPACEDWGHSPRSS